MPTLDILLRAGVIAIRGQISDLNWHSHHAIQLMLGADSNVYLENTNKSGHQLEITLAQQDLVIIGSDISHRVESEYCLVLLIEAESHLASVLSDSFLADEQHTQLIKLADQSAQEVLTEQDLNWPNIESLLNNLVKQPCLQRHYSARIKQLLDLIDQAEQEQQLHTLNLDWALDIIALSSSRFLHLFKDELGLPWRRYLLWRRLLAAVRYASQGDSLTHCAHAAGFSDSAHLSRVFKANFGINPKSVMKNSQFIQVS